MKFYSIVLSKLIQYFTLATVALLSVGCTTAYKEPVDSPKATISFVNKSSDKMFLQFYKGADECTNRMVAGVVAAKNQRNVIVPANQKLAFTVAVDNASFGQQLLSGMGVVGALVSTSVFKGCNPTLDFLPAEGKNYMFIVDAEKDSCTYRFFEGNSLDAQPSSFAATFSIREWTRPFDESGPFCKAP